MKCFFISFLLFLLTITVQAEYYKFVLIEVVQPDKTIIQCFTSGDEFYHWLHDKDGYTIVQSDTNGYFYYAMKNGENLVPSKYKVGSIDPKSIEIEPWLKISPVKYYENKNQRSKLKSVLAVTHGTLANIVVYVRFKNDVEYTKTRQDFSNMLNNTTGLSLKGYYNEVSYGKLGVESSQFPICDLTTNLSFQDTLERGYYVPYNAVTNPIGYKDDSGIREQSLVERAINAVKSQIPSNLVVDADADGLVDNVTIVVRGNSEGWGKLLWPHQWSLYLKSAYVSGKQVSNYIFITENMFDVGTMCHEMFHVIGAPDLYHYTGNGIDPVGDWSGGLSHMLAYMKWKYSGRYWISNIPEITATGDYSLKPLTSATNNCYKIKSPYSSTEFYTLEFRKKLGLYEENIQASGMIITRINVLANGNGNGPPDEVYVCRPQGTPFSTGDVSSAAFNISRSSLSSTTNPRAFLSDGTDAGIVIKDIAIRGDSMVFHVDITNSGLQKTGWLVTTDSYENGSANDPGTKAVDDNSTTIWHTPWSNTTVPYPHWIKIDFKKSMNIKGFKYLPRQDMENGRIKDYEFYTSNDGANWDNVINGAFQNNTNLQIVTFAERNCRYIKLVAKNEVNAKAFASIAELDFVFNTPLLPKTNWKLLNASSYEPGNDPKYAFDSNGNTFWHSRWSAPTAQYPHEFAIDMGEPYCIEGATYLPRQDGNQNGTITKYEFYSSTDAINWKLLSKGLWAGNFSEKLISFQKTVCRYIKIIALSELNAKAFASICEIGVFGTKSNDVNPPLKPLNFHVASKNSGKIKLSWDKDAGDNSVLFYNVYSSDSLIGKVYTNEISVNIDTTKKYKFSLLAIDGSGNQSDTASLGYSWIYTGNVSLATKPEVYASNGKIYVSKLQGEISIKIYDVLGRLLYSKNCFEEGNVEMNNYRGIAIVSIEQSHRLILRQKVFVD